MNLLELNVLAATVCWYILIGIVFLIAFVALVLSVLYFVSGEYFCTIFLLKVVLI